MIVRRVRLRENNPIFLSDELTRKEKATIFLIVRALLKHVIMRSKNAQRNTRKETCLW